jgi:hypothetical protein
MKFIGINCENPSLVLEFDSELEFILPIVGSTGNTSFIVNTNTICINSIDVDYSTQYPQGTWGTYSNIVTEILPGEVYNGAPVFTFSFTESDHNIPGLIINLYILYNDIEQRWELWEGFDPITGPFCITCCDGVDRPFLYTTENSPVTGPNNIWISTSPDNSICEETNAVAGMRIVIFCKQEVTVNFSDCWTFVQDPPENFPITNFLDSINLTDITFYEDCEDCLGIKNTPPCIRLTNCFTNESILVSYTEELNSYVGKTIKVATVLNGYTIDVCYTVSYSDVCPENPTLLSGTIVDCFTNCEKCLPKCICSKGLNSGTVSKKLTYLDCNYQIKETTENVAPGKYSKKYCVLQWLDTDVTQPLIFGDCIDNKCPEVVQPKKFVAPGYDTPVCTPSHYEKIVCSYAENKYVQTMSKRYGLNVACNDDDQILPEIRFELLQMQILQDPDYECKGNTKPDNCNC